ncbi:hypothetical protein F5146DRAFT_1004365 [Armillaria mellea]|nr:hypothetical protein F5146DRAFT_1004365 [Armillaria mellea]
MSSHSIPFYLKHLKVIVFTSLPALQLSSMETPAIIKKAIAAVNRFIALSESEKTLDGAKRVAAMMDKVNKFLTQSSKDQDMKKVLKEQLEEVKARVPHLAHQSDGALQFQDYLNKTDPTLFDLCSEGKLNEENYMMLTKEMQLQDIKEHLGHGGKRDKIPRTSVIGSSA